MQAWIATGGASKPETMEPVRTMPLTDHRPPGTSNSESRLVHPMICTNSGQKASLLVDSLFEIEVILQLVC